MTPGFDFEFLTEKLADGTWRCYGSNAFASGIEAIGRTEQEAEVLWAQEIAERLKSKGWIEAQAKKNKPDFYHDSTPHA